MLLSSSYLLNGRVCVCEFCVCFEMVCSDGQLFYNVWMGHRQTDFELLMNSCLFIKITWYYRVQSLWKSSTPVCLWWRGWVQIYFQFAVYRSSQQGDCVYGSRMKCTNWWGNVVWQQIDFSSSFSGDDDSFWTWRLNDESCCCVCVHTTPTNTPIMQTTCMMWCVYWVGHCVALRIKT